MPRHADFVANAQQNMERYGPKPYEIGGLVTSHLVDDATRFMAYEVHDDFLAQGSEAAAFTVQASDATTPDVLTASYTPAVTADHFLAKEQSIKQIDEHLVALRRAKGLQGHVQLQAADTEHGLIITTKAPGKDIAAYEESIEPTDEHWQQLRKTARGMRRRGIGFDAAGGNVHWDPDAGFTVHDTHAAGLHPKTWVKPKKMVANIQKRVDAKNNVDAGVIDLR